MGGRGAGKLQHVQAAVVAGEDEDGALRKPQGVDFRHEPAN